MAKRYSGTLILDVRYVGAIGAYAVRICERDAEIAPENLTGLRLSPFDAARVAVDSACAYDLIARAALAFASNGRDDLDAYADIDDDRGIYCVYRTNTQTPTVERVRLDKGGYSPTGFYWGIGEKLWRATTECGFCAHFRAASKADAVKRAREIVRS